jgi:hypothetical protein
MSSRIIPIITNSSHINFHIFSCELPFHQKQNKIMRPTLLHCG